jgi:hypothetical protein
MLHKDYDNKGSVKKIGDRLSQVDWHKDKVIGGKLPVLK